MNGDTTPQLTGWSTLRQLSSPQWFVFFVATLAWCADCMDQQLFNLARRSAIMDLTGLDANHPDVRFASHLSTSFFLMGWGVGGLYFGITGDRRGRVKTLTLTILLYSVFTGLSAFSRGVWDFHAYRFLTGLGVGGVFAAAVALLAESMPASARPYTLGLMQASSTVGNCIAAAFFILFGLLQTYDYLGGLAAWRLLFLVGLAPALLVIFIQRRLDEPDAWIKARDLARIGEGQPLGRFGELITDPRSRRHATLGVLLAFTGVVLLWGIGFYSIDLQQGIFASVFEREAQERGLTGAAALQFKKGQGIIWAGVTSFMLNLGGFFGMTGFSGLTQRIGRRPAFAVTFVAAGASTAYLFLFMRTRFDILWMTPVMGFCLMALFGGYAIYLPELFPTRLRATGTSFCYNVGRFVAAIGPWALSFLTVSVFTQGKGSAERYAGAALCSIIVLGLAVLPFLPETKDQPLPE